MFIQREKFSLTVLPERERRVAKQRGVESKGAQISIKYFKYLTVDPFDFIRPMASLRSGRTGEMLFFEIGPKSCLP